MRSLGVHYEVDRCTQTSPSTGSKTKGSSSPTVYLERSNISINNTFSTADESCDADSFDEEIERSEETLCSRILHNKREKALRKIRRRQLRKDSKAKSQAPSQSLESSPRDKIESRKAAKVKEAMSKRNKWRNPTTGQSNKRVPSIRSRSKSIAGRRKFVKRPVDVNAQMCHSPASTASVSDDSDLPFDGELDELRTPGQLATPHSLKDKLDAAGQGRSLCPQSLSREIMGLNLRDLPDLQAENRTPDEVDF